MGNSRTKINFNQSLRRSKKSPVSGLILIIMFLLSFNSGIKNLSAQSIVENWQEPINLSNSGGTDNPYLVKGNSGELHTLWEDDYANLVNRNYTDSWGQNFALDLDFSGQQYKILADNNGLFYVFWINQTNNNLQFSGVSEGNFGNGGSWSAPATIASAVVAFDFDIDENNQVHLIYTRALDTPEIPAGIFYQRSLGGLSSWTDARLIYESKYYRSMIPPEGENGQIVATGSDLMHVNVTTKMVDGSATIFLGWENPYLRRLFFDVSRDNGQTWGQPQEIISPSQDLILITPANLETIFLTDQVFQIWQMKEPGGNCSLQYRISSNNGVDWTTQQSLDSVFGRCPDTLNWDILSSGELLFIAQNQNTVFLVVWNGSKWSLPQGQTALNQFINPATLDIIEFENISPVVFNDTLFLVGKDKSNSKDIFFTQKKLTNIQEWFSDSSNWSPIQSTLIGSSPITGMSAVRGENGRFHFLITSNNNEKINASNFQILSVSSSESPILSNLQDNLEGLISSITSKTSPLGDRTVALWQGGKLGQIYSKWAFLDQIDNPVGWSSENQIQTSSTGQFPALASTKDNEYVGLFSNSFDDQKGLFFIKSEKGGENWSVPTQILDLTSLESCPFLDQSSIAADHLDNIYLLFECSTFPGGIGDLSMFSMQSTDLGISWSEPSLVVEKPVTWNQIILDNENSIHRLWKIEEQETSIWHSYSLDQGNNWSAPTNLALLEEKSGPTSATSDADGKIHLLQTYYSPDGNSVVAYYIWDGSKWINSQNLDLGTAGFGVIHDIVAGIDSNNNLQVGIAFNTTANNVDSGTLITANYPLSIENLPVENNPENPSPINNTITTTTVDNATQVAGPSQTVIPEELNKQPSKNPASFLSIIVGVGISFVFIVVILFFMRNKFINKS